MSDKGNLENLEKMRQKLDAQADKYLSGKGNYCAFCGKEKSEVERMWAAPDGGVLICNECVVACYSMFQEEV